MPLSASSVDPCDQSWEADAPDYRVYFHALNGAADEWELKGCDVDDAKDWATEHAAGRTFVLYAVVRSPGELGLVRLMGADPNAGEIEGGEATASG
jgi:hypothetical protein